MKTGICEVNETETRKFKVLVVDDHPIVRHGLGELIARQPDLEVCGEAIDIAGALRIVEVNCPDAAIVDISLGGENGIELIEQLKSLYPDVKVLVSSMHDEKTYAGRVLRAGAFGYINKRESIRQVIDALRQILRGEIYLSPEMASILVQRAAHGTSIDDDPASVLTNRELEIFELIGRGVTTQQIAGKLLLSPRTVETHRKNIKRKLNLANGAQLNHAAFQWIHENL